MEEEISNKFEKVNQTKIEFENKKKKLTRERDELRSYKASIGEEVSLKTATNITNIKFFIKTIFTVQSIFL